MYCCVFKYKEVIEVFLEMWRVGCKLDLMIYSLMISVYGKVGFVEEVVFVFR